MRIAFILFIFLPLLSICQTSKNADVLPIVNNKVVYTEVVELGQGYTVNQFHKNAKIWLSKEQNHFNNQLFQKDEWNLDQSILFENENEIFGVCRISINTNPTYNYYAFNVHLLLKDGKYKYEFSNFRFIGSNIKDPLAKRYEHTDEPLERVEKSKNQMNLIKTEMEGLIRDFKEDMARRSDLNF
jgi:hypothetical protein